MKPVITVEKGSPYPMGVSILQEDEINIAAALDRRKECGVILYPKAGGKIKFAFGKTDWVGGVACMKLKGQGVGTCAYNFYQQDQVITDPYAEQILGNEGWGRKVDPALRGRMAAGAFDWGGDRPLKTPLCDSVLYLLHVRGFTRHASSGVTARGTFAGITEKLPYLKALGITAVELMPAYEFVELERPKTRRHSMAEAVAAYRDRPEDGEKPRINYWGYKKAFYMAPKASYSSTEDPGTEFKEMVKKLHENGIEVILQFYFPKEIRASYMLEVIRHWVCEYHIDGAHLLGEQLPVAMFATDPMLADTKLFYYEFPCEQIYPAQEAPDYQNLACYREDFMYDMRKFLRGDEDMLPAALYQLKKNPAQTGVVNYMANYEGFSLMDMVSYENRHNEDNGEENRDGNPYNASWNCGAEGKTRKKTVLLLRQRQLRNAMTLLFTAQGTPMIVSGDEFGQSRQGNNNAYCQDNAVSWLNWELTEQNGAFLSYVKELIALRKAHPILHKEDELHMTDYIACGYPDLSYHSGEAWRLAPDRHSREAGLMYCGFYAKIDRSTDDDFFYIAYNMYWEKKQFALPDLPEGMHWEKIMDTACQETLSPQPESKTVTVEERSIQILRSFGRSDKEGKKIEGVTAF